MLYVLNSLQQTRIIWGSDFLFTIEIHLCKERLTGALWSLSTPFPDRDDDSTPACLGSPASRGTQRLHPPSRVHSLPTCLQPTGSAQLGVPAPRRRGSQIRAGDSDSKHRYRGERDREREGTAGPPRDRFASPRRGHGEGGGPRAHRWAGERLLGRLFYAPLSSAQARGPRGARGPIPRLSQSQEASRAGFQGDARESGGRGSRAEQVTALSSPSQVPLFKPPGPPVPPVTQPWPLAQPGPRSLALVSNVARPPAASCRRAPPGEEPASACPPSRGRGPRLSPAHACPSRARPARVGGLRPHPPTPRPHSLSPRLRARHADWPPGGTGAGAAPTDRPSYRQAPGKGAGSCPPPTPTPIPVAVARGRFHPSSPTCRLSPDAFLLSETDACRFVSTFLL